MPKLMKICRVELKFLIARKLAGEQEYVCNGRHFGSSELDLFDHCERSSLSLFEFISTTPCLLATP